MSDKTTKGGPQPSVTGQGPSGDHLTPEGANVKLSGPKRQKYPKGNEPRPGQQVKGGPSGDSQNPGIKAGKRVPPVATREGKGAGKPAGRTSNPFSGSQGGFGSVKPVNGSKSNPL